MCVCVWGVFICLFIFAGLVVAAFPLTEMENEEQVLREIAGTINMKCREIKKSKHVKRSQQTSQ